MVTSHPYLPPAADSVTDVVRNVTMPPEWRPLSRTSWWPPSNSSRHINDSSLSFVLEKSLSHCGHPFSDFRLHLLFFGSLVVTMAPGAFTRGCVRKRNRTTRTPPRPRERLCRAPGPLYKREGERRGLPRRRLVASSETRNLILTVEVLRADVLQVTSRYVGQCTAYSTESVSVILPNSGVISPTCYLWTEQGRSTC
jgi:hypothetical protein